MRENVRQIADAIGLRDWTINLNYEPPDDTDAMASVSCVYGRRIATISFCSDWWERDPHERHHVIVHELIHVVTNPLNAFLEEALPVLIGQPTWQGVYAAIRQHDEHAVDQLATALSPYMPVMAE